MKKTIILFIITVSLLFIGTLSASAAKILSATCSKDGVMLYTPGSGADEQVDEDFYFTIEATGDTKSILMQGAGKEPAEIAKNEFNSAKDDVVTLYSIKYACDEAGLRTFRFWAVDADGNRTPYEKVVNLQCYPWDETEQTVYSVDVANDTVRLAKGNSTDIDQRINLIICTSINTYDLKLTNESGVEINDIRTHCLERGDCNIVNGKKYWSVYFTSVIEGKRVFTFQAVDKNGAAVGDKKSVEIIVYPDDEYAKLDSGKGNSDSANQADASLNDSKASGNGNSTENKEGNSNQGNCCKKDNFISIECPAETSTVVIKKQDGEKLNIADMIDKDLANVEDKDDNSKIYTVWVDEDCDKDKLDITVYDKDYVPSKEYTIVDVKDFDEDLTEKFTKAIENEIRIQTNPNQLIIKLQINNEYMDINGEKLEIDPGRGTKPLIINGRTLLPVRAIIEALGGSVSWDAAERKVGIKIYNKDICLWIGSNIIKTNNIPEEMDVEAMIINERTMLPIRYVAECIDHTTVDWNFNTETVTITYNY